MLKGREDIAFQFGMLGNVPDAQRINSSHVLVYPRFPGLQSDFLPIRDGIERFPDGLQDDIKGRRTKASIRSWTSRVPAVLLTPVRSDIIHLRHSLFPSGFLAWRSFFDVIARYG